MEKLWDPCPFLVLFLHHPQTLLTYRCTSPVSSPFRLACPSVAVPDAARCSVGRCSVPWSWASSYSGTASPALAPH